MAREPSLRGRGIQRIVPGPGQESVWDFPRAPRAEAIRNAVRVEADGVIIARSDRALRVVEEGLAPAYYIPAHDVARHVLEPSPTRTRCPWKGIAVHYDVVLAERRIHDAAWAYPDPSPAYAMIQGHFSFYPHRVDCFVDRMRARPQGGHDGAWVTSQVVGPFRGEPGAEE